MSDQISTFMAVTTMLTIARFPSSACRTRHYLGRIAELPEIQARVRV